MSDIKRRAVSGVKWNTASTIILMLVQILRLSVLTRLLDKADFGLVAIATMVIGFTDIFSELGLTVSVIHKQDITDKQYSSVYWTNIILSIIVFSVLWLVSPLVAAFYEQPVLSTIIPLLGLQVLLNGFGKMFQTIKSKNMEFAFISKVKISACLVGFVATILFALFNYGVYSLVFGQLIQVAVMQLTYAYVGRKQQKILWYLDLRGIADFIKIGVYRLGSQMLDFVSSRLDVFLIGKFFGMDDLGVYNLAKDLITRPYGMVNMLTSNVASSAFSLIQEDIEKVKEYYCRIINIVSAMTTPIYFLIFLCADLIVHILYGHNFYEVATLLRILAFYGIESSISSQGAILQVSLGRTDVGFRWTVLRIVCSFIVIIAASQLGIKVVAIGQLCLAILSLYLFWLIAIKPILDLRFTLYVKSFISSILVSIVCSLPILIIHSLANLNLWWQFSYAFIYSLFYIIYYLRFQPQFIKGLIDLFINKRQMKR